MSYLLESIAEKDIKVSLQREAEGKAAKKEAAMSQFTPEERLTIDRTDAPDNACGGGGDQKAADACNSRGVYMAKLKSERNIC